MIISSLAETAPRRAFMQFSSCYYFQEQTQLMRTEKDQHTLHLKTLEDLNRPDVTLAVVPGTGNSWPDSWFCLLVLTTANSSVVMGVGEVQWLAMTL